MEFITVDEIAEYLRISRMTVVRMIEKGELPALKIGRQWRIQKEDFEKWIRGKKNNPSN